MNAKEIVMLGGGGLVVLLTLVEIVPIKLNPWSAIGKWLGRVICGELLNEVGQLKAQMDKIEKDAGERAAKDCRVRILRFGDEIRHHVRHSKEHFDQILLDITEYKKYCDEHEDFVNDMTSLTTELIMETYYNCLREDSFL